MILNPKNTNVFFDKTDFKLDERNQLKLTYGEDRIYFCACNKKVPYKLSVDNRFYPCNLKIKHEKTCPESDEYKNSQKRMPAYKNEETDDGRNLVKVKVWDKTKTNKKVGDNYLGMGRKCRDNIKSLSLESFLEILFLSSYATMKKSLKRDVKDIYKIAYAKICSTTINYNGKDYPLKADETPFKIFYGRLDKITAFKKETKDGVAKVYTVSLNGREVDVSEEDLNDAINRFKAKYNSSLKVPLLCAIRRMKSKYKMEKAFFVDTEIFFYPITEKGCICDSILEQNIVNEIEAIEDSQSSWYYYKPYEYGYGAFGDTYLEDGVIFLRNNYKRVCLEFVDNNKTSIDVHKLKMSSFKENNRYKLLTLTKENYSDEIIINKIKEASN